MIKKILKDFWNCDKSKITFYKKVKQSSNRTFSRFFFDKLGFAEYIDYKNSSGEVKRICYTIVENDEESTLVVGLSYYLLFRALELYYNIYKFFQKLAVVIKSKP